MTRKPADLKALLKRAWMDFSNMIRIEASDEYGFCTCVTCGRYSAWNARLDAGHFIAKRSLNSSICFLEDNVWTQCKNCNCDGRVAWLKPFASVKEQAVATNFALFMLRTVGQEQIDAILLRRNTVSEKTGVERMEEITELRSGWQQRIKVAKGLRGIK